MKIQWGSLVVDGRGKLGGHVGSANKAGSYLRTKVTPVNPQTVAQTNVRSLFGAISQAWSGLGASSIKAWNSAVSEWQQTNIFGSLKLPSGKALYQRLNNQAQIAGYPAVVLPPAKLSMVSGTLTASPIDISDTSIDLTGAYAGADATLLVYGSGPVSAGTTFVKNKMRLIDTQVANAYSNTDAYTAYVAKFGSPVLGQKVYIGVKYVLPTGQASPLQTVQATITA